MTTSEFLSHTKHHSKYKFGCDSFTQNDWAEKEETWLIIRKKNQLTGTDIEIVSVNKWQR